MKIIEGTIITIEHSDRPFQFVKKTYKELSDSWFVNNPSVLEAITVLLEEYGSVTVLDDATKNSHCKFKI